MRKSSRHKTINVPPVNMCKLRDRRYLALLKYPVEQQRTRAALLPLAVTYKLFFVFIAYLYNNTLIIC